VAARSAHELYDAVMLDPNARGLVLGSESEPPGASVGLGAGHADASIYHAMMLTDSTTYLPDDILVKVDRASMGVSLESRVPMLDHRVIELAWQMPLRMKRRGGDGKWLLKQLLSRYVPAALRDRPKKGFGMPVGQWIRGGMREWAESLVSAERLQAEGLLDWRRVRAEWSRHLDGETRSGEGIWRVLMFQAWLAESQRA
ncbi:MAG: asparagine synthase-related protein, partial [Woeseiaceae bacterium]